MTLYRATAQGQVPMTPEEEAEFLADQAANAARIVVPQSITRRQGLQQLRIDGFTETDIETSILALQIPELDKDLALIEFRTSQEWQRNRPLVATMIAMLGKDASWGDAMFIAANKL